MEANGTPVPASAWIGFRLVLAGVPASGRGALELYLRGSTEPSHRLNAVLLPDGAYHAGFGLAGSHAAEFAVNFDDIACGSTSPSDIPADLWYLEDVGVEPLVVTLDGAPGRRSPVRALMSQPGDHWWDARSARLYLRSPVPPGLRWTEIEYAARRDAAVIEASFVQLRGLVLSHYNFDDGGIGLEAGRHLPTLSRPGLVGRHTGTEAADHIARPGHADSPWNRRVGAGAHLVAAPRGFGALNIVLGGWLSPPITTAIYVAKPGDPLVEVLYHPDAWMRVHDKVWKRAGNDAVVEAAILMRARPDFPSSPLGVRSRYVYQTSSPSGWALPDVPEFRPAPPPARGTVLRVRCPRGVRPPPDTDGYLAVFQPDGLVFEAYSPVVLSDGRIVCFSYGVTDARGALAGDEGGVCASLIPVHAGTIRDREIASGGVPHALALYGPEAQLAPAARWPALAWDRTNRYRGTLPMGSRLAIPPEIDLDAHGFASDAGRVIARAAQDYGLILVDRNGGDGLIIKTQHNAPADAAILARYDEKVWRDLRWMVARLKVVIS
ncbi:hypothetical protein [Roseicella aerolata]|uniref:Uncharacterized protein n=1 Tax=Roseicella aerolata TaxID=2883479 RepID=A0A9X1IJ82_9PROT|nr:hypothetical protein [Roseicella aerolata]MCB4825542.1 hypothetical protein [Roseicella aerolata]